MSRISLMNNNISALSIMNPNAAQSRWRGAQNDLISSMLQQYGSNNSTTPDPIQAYLSNSRRAADGIRSSVESVANALRNHQPNSTELNSAVSTEDAEGTETENRNLELVNAMRSMVNGFNSLMDSAHDVNDRGAERLFSQLVGLGRTYVSSLARIGITFNEHGYMDINQDAMNRAEASGELARFAEDGLGRNHGFISRLDRIGSTITHDPTSFLSASARRDVHGLTSVNSARVSNFASRLTALHNTGMLFDSMF